MGPTAVKQNTGIGGSIETMVSTGILAPVEEYDNSPNHFGSPHALLGSDSFRPGHHYVPPVDHIKDDVLHLTLPQISPKKDLAPNLSYVGVLVGRLRFETDMTLRKGLDNGCSKEFTELDKPLVSFNFVGLVLSQDQTQSTVSRFPVWSTARSAQLIVVSLRLDLYSFGIKVLARRILALRPLTDYRFEGPSLILETSRSVFDFYLSSSHQYRIITSVLSSVPLLCATTTSLVELTRFTFTSTHIRIISVSTLLSCTTLTTNLTLSKVTDFTKVNTQLKSFSITLSTQVVSTDQGSTVRAELCVGEPQRYSGNSPTLVDSRLQPEFCLLSNPLTTIAS
ncbi:13328_t:CDS:2 [Acaulospora colombiana]|uniref:13328_t:CDS:1 n=1 Tax=Acaulospora colombiana TaxID=27376 RepID=A0ACA9MQ91_9GLOM|nr:13328_t:CDS:2 [Acaulospora colombiana]